MTDQPAFALTTSRGFTGWLAGTGGSLAFTTCQGGKVFLLGVRRDGPRRKSANPVAEALKAALALGEC